MLSIRQMSEGARRRLSLAVLAAERPNEHQDEVERVFVCVLVGWWKLMTYEE